MVKSVNRKKTKTNISIPVWCYLLGSFLIPVASCMVFLVQKGVYPFGNQCILTSDMYYQYCPFFYNFARMLKSGSFSLYDWNMGLGADFVSTYSYYLSSSLNLLLLFVPEDFIIEFMTYSIVFRIGFCGFSFFCFLRYRFGIAVDQDSDTETSIVGLFLSTAYALSGYVAAYNWQIMWMDCVALAPLIFLGLLKMQREKKSALYYVSLAMAIFSNYYIALMICIFLVFYWMLLFFELEDKKERICFSLRFFIYSLLAGGTSATLIFPTISALSNSGSDMDVFPNTVEWYYSPLVALARGNAFSKSYAGSEYWPNIYAGVITLLLVLVFFFSQNISWKKKLTRILFIIFLQISFMNNILSFIWHGLRYPTYFPSRQSFLYVFLILTMGMEGYLQLNNVKKKELLLSALALIVLVFFSAFAEDKEITGWFSFRITGVLIFVYSLLYFLSLYVDADARLLLRRIIIIIAFFEVLFSMKQGSFYTQSRDQYVGRIEEIQKLLDLRAEDGFYRTDMPFEIERNDGTLMGYPSLSVFNTILNIKVVDYYVNHCMDGSEKTYVATGITPILSAMLNERYQIIKGDEVKSTFMTCVGKEGEYRLYENKYYLPIGFTIPEELFEENVKEEMLQNGINDLPVLLMGKEAYSQTSLYTQKNKLEEAEIVIEEDGYFYLKNTNSEIYDIELRFPDGSKRLFSGIGTNNLMELGYAEKGSRFVVTNPNDYYMNFELYRADLDVIKNTLDILGRHPFTLDGKNTSWIEGKITVDEGEKVFFSIPADKGWKAFVDGKEITLESYFDAFLCLSPDAGEHVIRLEYEVPYLKAGMVISLMCIGITFILFIMIPKKKGHI